MAFLKVFHQLVAFLLELVMLGSLGLWGYRAGKSTVVAWLLAVGLPLLAATLWGIWAAPRSDHRLPMPYLALFSITLFWLAAYGLHQAGYPRAGLTMAVGALISTGLSLLIPE